MVMKRTVTLLSGILAWTLGFSQLNENDTTITSVASKSGSVQVQAHVFPDYVDLIWTKGPDEYIGYFELYRSPDGTAYRFVKQFQPGSFEANDNSYAFQDKEPLEGRNYYRIVGYDQYTSEKRTVDLVVDFKNQSRKIGPSLFSRGSQLYVSHYDGEPLHLWLYNSMGNPVVQNRWVNGTFIPLPETLSGGMYIYQLVDDRKMVVSSGKLVIQ